MGYCEEIVIAGKTIEVTKKYQTKRKNIKRGQKSQSTSEEQKLVNRNRAVRNLRLLLNHNFRDNVDFHIVLTYRKKSRPQLAAQARDSLDKFMRELRKIYKKSGRVLKYVTVTEYKRAAIHHHLVISDADAKEISKLWGHGRINATPLYTNGQYGELAEYLIKETDKTFNGPDAIYKKRWNSSKNLKQPLVIKKVKKARVWRKDPRPKKGYYIEKGSVYNGTNPFTGGSYQFYRMIRIEPQSAYKIYKEKLE